MNVDETERGNTNRGNINTLSNQHIAVTLGAQEDSNRFEARQLAPQSIRP
jgi:hypothetical protein